MTIPIKIISKKEFLKLNKKPDQEEVWDNISDLWEEFKRKPFFDVEDFLKNKKGRIIDLGCGTGRNMVKSYDIEYYGVDFSKEQLKHAKKHINNEKINAKLFRSEAYQLDKNIFKDDMFDYGLFIATLHCIEGEENRKKALLEFYRVLKKRAEALISVWNSSDERFKAADYHGDIYMSWKKDGKEHMRYYYLYDLQELLDLINSVGFKILEIKKNLDVTSNPDRFSKKNWIFRIKKP